ncbi:MAG: transcription antitermination factor NusB [Phycisphaerae bacterium]
MPDAAPRDIALRALGDRAGNITAHLDRLLASAGLSDADRALARELALGVTRRRKTCSVIARAFLTRPDQKLPRVVAAILEMAVYQVLFLDRVPAFAAVNEAVEQVARKGHPRMRGLVNAVLRSLQRCLQEPADGPCPMQPDAVAVDATRWIPLARPLFADPQKDPAAWLAQQYSLPRALVDRWLHHVGSAREVAAVGAHGITRAPLILRVNTLRGDLTMALETLAGQDIAARPHENGQSLVLDSSVSLTDLAAFRAGLIQPQDPAATAVGAACRARPGSNVLDFCAAPGTKTTHLAEQMGNRGSIVALDVSAEKTSRIEENCRRMGIDIVRTALAESAGGLDPESFDLVLADVPCSNTGVLSRRAEARWGFEPKVLSTLAEDQKFLIRAAAGFVKPGGTLVYSTCSIEPEENEQVVAYLLRQDKGMTLKTQKRTLPGGAADPTRWHDGGFCAVLNRR